MNHPVKPVPVEHLRWQCDEYVQIFQSTEELESYRTILGQERALRALTLGLEMDYPGYNIFVSGETGTGRRTTVHFMLHDQRFHKPVPDDLCYVYNFAAPDMPRVLQLSAGSGMRFRKAMEECINQLRMAVPQTLESERIRKRREALLEKYALQQSENLQQFEKRAQKDKFTLVQVQVGSFAKPDVLPVIDGQPVPLESLGELAGQGKLDDRRIAEIQQIYIELNKELARLIQINQKLQREKQARLADLEHEAVKPVIEEALNEVRSAFAVAPVSEYLDAVLKSLLENLGKFSRKMEGEEAAAAGQGDPVQDPFLEYRVNVLVNNGGQDFAPIIFENSPTQARLFGSIERLMDSNGQWRTDFTHIRAGSLLQANGGFLVLQARDLLLEAGVWPNLKRMLKIGETEINANDPALLFAITAMKPQPIALSVKVILLGDPYLYQLLYAADDDFRKIFKIKAEFDSEMPNNATNLRRYAEFIKRMCDEQELQPFDASAVAEVAEYGVRLAGRQNKLTTRFTYINDLLREADYFARAEKTDIVTQRHVEQALAAADQRLNLIEEKIRENIREGTILIDTDGSRVGQVNGLTVLSMGDYHFGMPARITARSSMGRQGIINIEREVEMSGPTHDKGVLILSGYLQGKFSQDRPLSINASLCFEQSYGGIDGDSASSAELYALLSRLADLPLRQDLAVTGSVNQNGEIQPIGGVNEKIEGFFEICRMRGLTGSQGVIIPRQNVADLMLRNELIEAVRAAQFVIYAVERIEEGIEILTGMPAGERDPHGAYPPETIFGRVDARLAAYAEGLRHYHD
ncbi:MAG TPA: AAA family ATPase [bacterium]|nr:AAA family ATPase [bacterium]HPR88290.1 AAA family ATPase [bacterium]